MTKRILEILDNVRYWETCPYDYKKDIETFLEELEALSQHDVIKSVCSCGRREINVLSGICDMCWNEKFPDEQTVI